MNNNLTFGFSFNEIIDTLEKDASKMSIINNEYKIKVKTKNKLKIRRHYDKCK